MHRSNEGFLSLNFVVIVVVVTLAACDMQRIPPRPTYMGSMPPQPRETLRQFPGHLAGTAVTRWVGPYVLFREVNFHTEKGRRLTVTWFSNDGSVLKELNDPELFDAEGGVTEHWADTTLVHSLCDTTVTVIPPWPGIGTVGFQTVNYGKHVYQYHFLDSGLYTKVYTSGTFVGTFGPDGQPTNCHVEMSESGSFAYTTTDPSSPHRCKLVAVDSLGQEVFSQSVDTPVAIAAVSHSGHEILVSYSAWYKSQGGAAIAACLSASRPPVQTDFREPAEVVGWVPNSLKTIVTLRNSKVPTYGLIDWSTGSFVWQTTEPLEFMPYRRRFEMAISERYFILSGLAIRQPVARVQSGNAELTGVVRMLAAIDIASGQIVAKWYERTLSGLWRMAFKRPEIFNQSGDLIWHDGLLYFVTDDGFSPIDFEDIAKLQNGWVAP